MSTGKLITPDRNETAIERIGSLAQPVVLQVQHEGGIVETKVLGGLTKLQAVATELLSGILSTKPNDEYFQETGDPVGTALKYAGELLRRSNEPDPPVDAEVFSGDQ